MSNSIKRFLIIASVVFLFVPQLFSLGAGVQAGVIPSVDINESGTEVNNFDANITGTVKCFRIPAVFGFGLEAGTEHSDFIFGASGFFDYWFIDYQLKNTWNLYSGAGASLKLMFSIDNSKYISAGPRFFVGTNWLFLDNYIEYYAQLNVVPSYVHSLDSEASLFRLTVPVETGVRLHF